MQGVTRLGSRALEANIAQRPFRGPRMDPETKDALFRLAELASAGHSNPQIAQSLFVTRKTVETHLGHVYRKLGIAGRHELGAALSGTVSGTLSGTT